MKKTTAVILQVIIAVILLSCKYDKKDEKVKPKQLKNIHLSNEDSGNRVDYDHTKVIKSIYVTDRNGAEMKQQASESSKTIGSYQYGTKLDVIEENGNWIGVLDRITRESSKNGSKIESTGWEKVYVLKSKTGLLDEISLSPSDLNQLSLLTINQKTENSNKEQLLSKYLKIELVDKSVFESKRNTAVNFLLADTLENIKKNGIIELQCQNRIVKYVDKPEDNDDTQKFDYVGQFEILNKYLISGSYWESSDYKLIDKTSGKETNVLGDYPYISSDKKYLICINANPYETTADLELYSISDQKIKPIILTSFKNWMPILKKGEMFWSTDDYLYVAVNHVNAFWTNNGALNEKCQFIRIKIL